MRVSVGELEIGYEMGGKDGAPVVVMVHGLAGSLALWEGQAERLAARFRVLRYDLRAHGSSEACEAPCSLSDLAADLVGLLDALDIDKAAVVGHSAGGVIAMQAALDCPDRVSALGLVGTSSVCNDRADSWYGDCVRLALDEGGEAVMKAIGMEPGSGSVPDGRGIAAVIEAIRSLYGCPITDRLEAVRVPALIVVGEQDHLGVGGSVILSRAIEGSELAIVPERGHAIFLEDPDGFAERLGGFLARHLL